MHVDAHGDSLANSLGDSLSITVADTVRPPSVPLTATQLTANGYITAMEKFVWGDTDKWLDLHPVIHGHLTMRHDSVMVFVDSLARASVQALAQRRSLAPRELMSLAALQIELGRDAEAQRNIERWLTTPGLSQRDSLLAFGTAMALFLRTFDETPTLPARVQIAREYLRRLEAMPRSAAATEVAGGRFLMLNAYVRAGQTDSALSAGLRGFQACRESPDWERRARCTTSEAILDLTLALSSQPHADARIDSLLTALRRELVVPQALLARDTALGRLAPGLQYEFEQHVGVLRWFGHAIPPLVATHWLNHPTPPTPSAAAPQARALPVNDGIIRIIGFGWFTCPACQRTLRHMQVDQALLPKGVQMMYYEWTEGAWGSDLVEPEEEVQHLKHYWLERRHYTFPIAIWAGPKDSTASGGLLPRESPIKAALHITAGPTFFVVDGHGVVRHWQQGYGTYKTHFARVIDLLVRERDQAGPPVATTPLPRPGLDQ